MERQRPILSHPGGLVGMRDQTASGRILASPASVASSFQLCQDPCIQGRAYSFRNVSYFRAIRVSLSHVSSLPGSCSRLPEQEVR